MSHDNNVLSALQTPRPNRHARRALAANPALDLGSKSGHAPVPQQSPCQIGFAHSPTHLVLVITDNIGQRAIPMDAGQWTAFKAGGDTEMQAMIDGQIPAEPEPAPVYDDDEAVLIRQRIEDCAEAYGHFHASPELICQAFRHPNHLTNWMAKHRLEAAPRDSQDPADGVTFYPATGPAPIVKEPAGTAHVGPAPFQSKSPPDPPCLPETF
jgi:hypothetical protein